MAVQQRGERRELRHGGVRKLTRRSESTLDLYCLDTVFVDSTMLFCTTECFATLKIRGILKIAMFQTMKRNQTQSEEKGLASFTIDEN